MPLQPSRKDSATPISIIRHHQSSLRSRDPGYLDGRWSTPQPVIEGPSEIVGGDAGGFDGEDNAVIGEDGDRLTLADLDTQTWTLSYIPIAETLHVHWHPDAGAGVEWKRDEHYFIDDDDQIITIYAEALAAVQAEVGDVFSAQYLRLDGESDAPTESRVDDLTLRGYTGQFNAAGGQPLPPETEVGDFIVALCATAVTVGSGHGQAYIDDPRLTQVGHAMWVGIATDLGPVNYVNPIGDRMTGAMATFVAGVFPGASGTSGPGGAGSSSLAAPTPAGSAAVMGFVEENPNGASGSIDAWPTGYIKVTPDSGTTVCKAYVLYWPPDGVSNSAPAGSVNYTAHSTSGVGWVDVTGLQAEEL